MQEQEQLKLAPDVRLAMTIEREFALDPDGKIFNDELHQKYLAMHSKVVERQDGIAKSLVMTEIALAFLISGKNLTIPGVGLALSDIPAALELVLVANSFCVLFVVLTYKNAQLYQAIAFEFSKRATRPMMIDPEFVSSAHIYTELTLKSFRTEMNIWGRDFFEPMRGFKIFYGTLVMLLQASMIGLAFLHYTLVGYGWWLGLTGTWFSYIFTVTLVLLNVAAILTGLAPGFNFLPAKASATQPPPS